MISEIHAVKLRLAKTQYAFVTLETHMIKVVVHRGPACMWHQKYIGKDHHDSTCVCDTSNIHGFVLYHNDSRCHCYIRNTHGEVVDYQDSTCFCDISKRHGEVQVYQDLACTCDIRNTYGKVEAFLRFNMRLWHLQYTR